MDPAKMNLLYPRSRYYGKFNPAALMFNDNLQQFAHQVSYISGLHTGGKLSEDEALQRIEQLWQSLDRSKKQLGIDTSGIE
jgi:hypothetical protein